MPEMLFETALLVDTYYELYGEDGWHECSEDTRQAMDDFKAECREQLGDTDYQQLEFADISFIEFDSSNHTHAAGYFSVKVIGPEAILDRLMKLQGGEDA